MRATRRNESGMGLPHSKTLARRNAGYSFRKVVECGSPMPLWNRLRAEFSCQSHAKSFFCVYAAFD